MCLTDKVSLLGLVHANGSTGPLNDLQSLFPGMVFSCLMGQALQVEPPVLLPMPPFMVEKVGWNRNRMAYDVTVAWKGFLRVPGGCSRGGGGTLGNPKDSRENWGTLGNLRED